MPRHEFSKSLRDVLSKRVSLRCSNPACRGTTTGPHSAASTFVDVGVASHITAAAPGGPRYDQALTVEERTSLENAIWLCQRCAKLIDDDVLRYDIAVLRRWKVAAEAEALRAINGSLVSDFFPQPVSAVHTPIPRLPGLIYDEARELLLNAGWQPRRQHWTYASEPDVQFGNGKVFWERGYWEIIHASGTGLGHCSFGFQDVYGNKLTVVTAGEEDDEFHSHACVWNWYFPGPDA
ncbi:MAG: hypothetical protein ACXWCY_32940 [Burkholderiales bacterium]